MTKILVQFINENPRLDSWIRKQILRFFIKQRDRSLGSWCVEGTKKSTLEVDFNTPWSERSRIDLFSKETQNPFSDSFGFKNPFLDVLKETQIDQFWGKWYLRLLFWLCVWFCSEFIVVRAIGKLWSSQRFPNMGWLTARLFVGSLFSLGSTHFYHLTYCMDMKPTKLNDLLALP